MDNFEVFLLDGTFTDFPDDPAMPYLHFRKLDKTEAFFLIQLALQQGLQVVLYREEESHGQEETSPAL